MGRPGPDDANWASSRSASPSALAFTVCTAFRAGPDLSYASIRLRYCSTSARHVIRRDRQRRPNLVDRGLDQLEGSGLREPPAGTAGTQQDEKNGAAHLGPPNWLESWAAAGRDRACIGNILGPRTRLAAGTGVSPASWGRPSWIGGTLDLPGGCRVMTLTPGTRIGPYEVVTPLGAGGMGEVYRARDTRLDRTVAIKVLPAEIAGDSQARERFEREARAVAALESPAHLHAARHRPARGRRRERGRLPGAGASGGRDAGGAAREGSAPARSRRCAARARSPRRSIAPTARASCTAISSRPTSC